MKQPSSVKIFSSFLLLTALVNHSTYAASDADSGAAVIPGLSTEPAPVILDGGSLLEPGPIKPPPVILDGTAPVEPPPVVLGGTTPVKPVEPTPVVLDGTTTPVDPIKPPPVILDGTAPVEPPPVVLGGTTPVEPVEPTPVVLDGTTTPVDPIKPPPVILDGTAPVEPPPVVLGDTTPVEPVEPTLVILDGTTAPVGPIKPPPVVLDGLTTEPYTASYSLSEFVIGETATFTASVEGDAGFLTGWVDWNGDGDYLDTGEKIISNAQDNISLNADQTPDADNNPGTLEITTTVPQDATLATTTALFHWSAKQSSKPSTLLPDGMAEEITLTVQSPTSTDSAPETLTPRLATDEGLKYTIRWNSDDNRYHVYMKPNMTPSPDLSLTGQITIRVPHASGADQFQISNLTSMIPDTQWNFDSRSNAPTEVPGSDYLSLSLTTSSATAFNWQEAQEIEVFNFTNGGACLGSLTIIENDTDPFNAPVLNGGTNSAMSNPGNQFNNLGWNTGDTQANNYAGNYGLPADCTGTLDTDNDGLSDLQEEAIGSAADNADTDGDGIGDALEAGINPANPTDTDNDGTADILDTDDDNDGLLTQYENYNGATPTDDDTDQDGTPDFRDDDDDGDGKPTLAEQADPNGDGNPVDAVDPDEDTIPGYLDADENSGISFRVRGILQGAYSGADGLMRDDLNQQNLIPAAQPFSSVEILLDHEGDESLSNNVASLQGSDAPVDWVLIELLDASDRETRLASRAAILQRDGDVVDASTGSTTITFPDIDAGNYYVGLNHRNHLGVVTLNPFALSATPEMIDFTLPALEVYGENARYKLQSISVLWGGEADGNNSIICNGPGNDVTALLSKVLTGQGNSHFNGNFRLSGYHKADFNLDGLTLFAGPDNDTNIAMGNVLLHPKNDTFSANFVVRGRKPQFKKPDFSLPGNGHGRDD